MNCPFKVGDRVRQKVPKMFIMGVELTDTGIQSSPYPIATVTSVSDDGFEYKYDQTWNVIPRLGMSFDGGKCFPNGYDSYELYELAKD